VRKLTVTLVLSMAVGSLGAACAPMTPAQNLAWDRWRTCDHFVTIHLVQILPSGDVVATGREYDAAPFSTCMQEVLVQQRSQGGAIGSARTTVRDIEGGAGMN